jgi:hypothetical protein
MMNSNNKIRLFVMLILITAVLSVMISSSITQLQAQKSTTSDDNKKSSTTSDSKAKSTKTSKSKNHNPKKPKEDNTNTDDNSKKQDDSNTKPSQTTEAPVQSFLPASKLDAAFPKLSEQQQHEQSQQGQQAEPSQSVVTTPPPQQQQASIDPNGVDRGSVPELKNLYATNKQILACGNQNLQKCLDNQMVTVPPPNPTPIVGGGYGSGNITTSGGGSSGSGIPFPNNCGNTQAYHFDKKTNKCILNSNCKSGTESKSNTTLVYCQDIITKKQFVVQKEQPIIKNYYTNTSSNTLANNLLQYLSNSPAQYLLLLDSKQLCLIAGDFQCVAQQNQFATSSLTTTYDSVNKLWSISGTVKDVSKFQLNNVQVTALFYDGKGNAVGNSAITNNIIPNILNTFEDGTFAFNVSVNNDLNGINPLFIVLSYNQQNANSSGQTFSNNQQNLNTISQDLISNQQNINTSGPSQVDLIQQPVQKLASQSTKAAIKPILELNPDFNITSTSTTKDSLNDLVVVGEVKNNAQVEKQLVQLIITAYDKNNNILTTDIAYTQPNNLQAGQSGPFKDYISEESVGGDINAIKIYKIAVTSN